jgi:hypothetical protein
MPANARTGLRCGGNGVERSLRESPGGGPESRLWAAVVERAHGRANSETRRRTVDDWDKSVSVAGNAAARRSS